MALFFDASWFDQRLATAGLTRDIVATALGLTAEQIAEVWKDQRELSARDVLTLSRFLGLPPTEIADRAGISTPVPRETQDMEARLKAIEERLARVEAALGLKV
jgi:transcriptional regulator with XRE-family HTH domain